MHRLDWVVTILGLLISIHCLVALIYLDIKHSIFLKKIPKEIGILEIYVLNQSDGLHKKIFLLLVFGAFDGLIMVAVGTSSVWLK